MVYWFKQAVAMVESWFTWFKHVQQSWCCGFILCKQGHFLPYCPLPWPQQCSNSHTRAQFSVGFAPWNTPLFELHPHFAKGNGVEHTFLGPRTHFAAKLRCGNLNTDRLSVFCQKNAASFSSNCALFFLEQSFPVSCKNCEW